MWGSDEAVVLEYDGQSLRTEEAMPNEIPDLCLSLIIPFLSPKDVARGSCVCREFQNTLDSDSVWDQLVPKSSAKVVELKDELKAATKKKIFLFLCQPSLLSDTLAYWLDQCTGGVCYSLAARGLQIVWGYDERYWGWSSGTDARWPEVAWLKAVCWFQVSGNIKCMLPPGAYTLSWRIQYKTRSPHGANGVYGWDMFPTEFGVSIADGTQATTSCRYLTNRHEHGAEQLVDLTPVRLVNDKCLEFDAGEITVLDEEKVTSLDFSMVNTRGGNWKGGIILDGVVLRPTSLTRTTGRYLSVEELEEVFLRSERPSVDSELAHPQGTAPGPRGRLGWLDPIWGLFPVRRGGIRHV